MIRKNSKDKINKLLSQIALDIVNKYKQIEEPEDWLFPGGKKGSFLTERYEVLWMIYFSREFCGRWLWKVKL